MGFIADYLREKFPLNRVVAFVTVAVAAPAAALGGTVAAWIADHAPYVASQFGPDQIVAAFVAGAAITAGALVTVVYKWMEGWQFHEQRIHEAAHLFGAGSDSPVGTPLLDEPGDDLARSLRDKPDAQKAGIGAVSEGEEFPTGRPDPTQRGH